MSGGSDFEMTKTQAFYVLEELKKFTEVAAVKDEIWDIQKQINRLDEYGDPKHEKDETPSA